MIGVRIIRDNCFQLVDEKQHKGDARADHSNTEHVLECLKE